MLVGLLAGLVGLCLMMSGSLDLSEGRFGGFMDMAIGVALLVLAFALIL